jgi:SAM-dependent methyltransferase
VDTGFRKKIMLQQNRARRMEWLRKPEREGETMEIFDRERIEANRDRAASTLPERDFLYREAAGDLVTRLFAINREFSLAADIGAGHGALSAALHDAFPQLRIVALDTSAALLRNLNSEDGGSNPSAGTIPLARIQAREEMLPLREGTFDLVFSNLALHLVNDLPGALLQIRRALKPDGLFLAALLGGDSLIELRQAMMLAETEILGGVSPRVFPTADVRDLGGLLQRAGFALPVADSEKLTVTYPDALALMTELKAMGAGNALSARRRNFMSRRLLTRAAEIYAERFSTEGGRVRATFEVIYLSGWAPHESQQKPLRPGSAAARLADALGTVEHAAGDKAAFSLSKKPRS